MSSRLLLIIFFFWSVSLMHAQKTFTVESPDKSLKIDITIDQVITYSVSHMGDLMLSKSPLSMKLTDGRTLGINARLSSARTNMVQQEIKAPIYKRAVISDHYNELTLRFKGNYTLLFRVYNDGVAYRWITNFKNSFVVESEQVVYNFPADNQAFVPYANIQGFAPFMTSFESVYQHIKLSQWKSKHLAFSPLVVEAANGKKICLAEADLLNYPGMFLTNSEGSTRLTGIFAPYPKEMEWGGYHNLQEIVKTTENYIAKCKGNTNFPWRVVIVSEKDFELADSDMIYKLATPTQCTDLSWIKPGKVAWEWWNSWNLYQVDFRAGINNDTYKYYIDFASRYGVEYVILDEGWAVNLKADLMQVVPEINLKELADYAKSKNVGLILWAGYNAFNRDMENICRHYAAMGIKGFKIDFMDRDDQLMVEFHVRAAEIAAKYKLLVDFHGTYKPTGLQRTYPNVINFEGVHGLEQMKWSPATVDQVTYDVTIPFIRMVAGPIDYTQGAMRNATKSNYRPVNSEAMSQGTRCRQLAEYIVFESPLNMLCDTPLAYMNEEECTTFISQIPTTWDNTVALNGEISKYISIARQKGNEWYVGVLTNWDARILELDLSFLGEGSYKAIVFKDGINADRIAHDYKKEIIDIPMDKKLKITLAPGGGYAMKIYANSK
ncbi:glycoside hydrolase family 97 protein [Bacteroides oleiciplenus]|uniref:Glycoside hydrolase 97 n=1 Tax=Bacteroides oleiciplenus YIT 12058 TaxID=742727 RepID=K9DZ13_9BACE|nr:glycoside hydrolase family 97 protein [Bacteroides oleiciplenus]EKU89678.1 hypothetical protein HMPREF9447_03116 [Bacteroides oleiciplenus YIT 12058]